MRENEKKGKNAESFPPKLYNNPKKSSFLQFAGCENLQPCEISQPCEVFQPCQGVLLHSVVVLLLHVSNLQL